MEDTKIPTERELLKERANLMGLKFAGNISNEKLKELVNGELGEPEEPTENPDENEIQKMNREQKALKRIILTCNDPQMKDWDTTPYLHISNRILQMPRIVVPFGVEWHVPFIYYTMLKEQECSISVNSKDEKGRKITKQKMIKKYNIQDLPPLTAKELQELKQAQIMRDGISNS